MPSGTAEPATEQRNGSPCEKIKRHKIEICFLSLPGLLPLHWCAVSVLWLHQPSQTVKQVMREMRWGVGGGGRG